MERAWSFWEGTAGNVVEEVGAGGPNESYGGTSATLGFSAESTVEGRVDEDVGTPAGMPPKAGTRTPRPWLRRRRASAASAITAMLTIAVTMRPSRTSV